MTPQEASIRSRELCLLAPVIPVLVVDDASKAADLARALVKGGLPVLEVTLRTACGPRRDPRNGNRRGRHRRRGHIADP